jgi:hypothetical protein
MSKVLKEISQADISEKSNPGRQNDQSRDFTEGVSLVGMRQRGHVTGETGPKGSGRRGKKSNSGAMLMVH